MTLYKVTFEDGGVFHLQYPFIPVKGTHVGLLDYLEKDIRDRTWKTIEKVRLGEGIKRTIVGWGKRKN